MTKLITITMLLTFSLMLSGSLTVAQTADEIMQKSHIAYYYAANDGKAEVTMRIINSKGKERIREFTMLRMDESDGGNQKYYTYFKKPSDVARMTFMVHKTTDGNDMRWIYVPSVDLIKPISADDKNSSFVGSDFSYEDVSGRHWTEDTHTMAEESELDDKSVWVIESTPKSEDYDGFARKVSYIDQETYLPLKEEYFDDTGKLIRIFRAEEVQVVDDIPTVTTRSMEDVEDNEKTIVEFSSIEYNVGVEKDIFTERYLKNPPRDILR